MWEWKAGRQRRQRSGDLIGTQPGDRLWVREMRQPPSNGWRGRQMVAMGCCRMESSQGTGSKGRSSGQRMPLSKCTDAGTRRRGLFLTLDVVAPSVAKADPGLGWGFDWLLPLDLRLLQGSCGVFGGRHSRPVAVTGGRCKCSRVGAVFFAERRPSVWFDIAAVETRACFSPGAVALQYYFHQGDRGEASLRSPQSPVIFESHLAPVCLQAFAMEGGHPRIPSKLKPY
jgi:hypothetical protein